MSYATRGVLSCVLVLLLFVSSAFFTSVFFTLSSIEPDKQPEYVKTEGNIIVKKFTVIEPSDNSIIDNHVDINFYYRLHNYTFKIESKNINAKGFLLKSTILTDARERKILEDIELVGIIKKGDYHASENDILID